MAYLPPVQQDLCSSAHGSFWGASTGSNLTGARGGQVCYTLAHLLDESISVIKSDAYVLGDGHWLV